MLKKNLKYCIFSLIFSTMLMFSAGTIQANAAEDQDQTQMDGAGDSGDTTPADNGSGDTTPANNGSGDTTPADNGSGDTTPADNGSDDTTPADNGSDDTTPQKTAMVRKHPQKAAMMKRPLQREKKLQKRKKSLCSRMYLLILLTMQMVSRPLDPILTPDQQKRKK